MPATAPVRLLDRRRFDPPREVLVEHDGEWWPGWQSEWLLCDDGRGWRGLVRWTQLYDWGSGQHVTTVPLERVRAVRHVG